LTVWHPYVMIGDISVLAVFYAVRLYRRGGVAFIKIDKSLTYRGDKTRTIYQSNKKISRSMIRSQYPRRRTPYWNFWKVILAGWMIRYPRPFFVALGFCIAVIYNAVTK
jgi:hypothetical protein